ncbi:GntR family transcriptional regulator [Nakamurella sp. PAMC28650]|uniref:GntR family transcriptional regulator n=1 Tax=Nakamurella sp. PAMC28650 TaxID=2762325 RepID=UPI00164ED8D1|nr:GntR family transcriptional regulator [Nakamurella sp. PAMC28650]QNK82147.1 GntR family transcriptional regulator [Nakamurella sp. PAMC28650]
MVKNASQGFRHLSLPESVHEVLRSRILNNELPAGTPLVEIPLAEEFGVSRTTVRAALRELQTERLIEVLPRRGTFVTRMSAEDVTEACYARFVLESSGLAEVWESARAALVIDMTDAVRVMQLACDKEDLAGIVEADTEFHRLIVQAGNHPRIVEMWSTLNGQMGALMRSSLDRQGIDMAEAVQRHTKLITAFRRKDSAVALTALRLHYLDPTHG